MSGLEDHRGAGKDTTVPNTDTPDLKWGRNNKLLTTQTAVKSRGNSKFFQEQFNTNIFDSPIKRCKLNDRNLTFKIELSAVSEKLTLMTNTFTVLY